MKLLDTQRLYTDKSYKIPETKWNAGKEAIVKDLKKRFISNGLDISYLSKKKILNLYYMIYDIQEFQSITMKEAIKRISKILKKPKGEIIK